jgi:hypothetical protein
MLLSIAINWRIYFVRLVVSMLYTRPRAVPRKKGGTADNTSRNEIRDAHTYNAKFPLVEIDVPVSEI